MVPPSSGEENISQGGEEGFGFTSHTPKNPRLPRDSRSRDLKKRMHFLIRGLLLFLVVGWVAVFAIALRLNPYQTDGTARVRETHRQLGLPPCTFFQVTEVPCPSCGMTTSFSLLMRADLANAFRANFVGALLAMFGLLFIPWALVSIARHRPLFIPSIEIAAMIFVGVLFSLMLVRWAILLGMAWTSGDRFTPPDLDLSTVQSRRISHAQLCEKPSGQYQYCFSDVDVLSFNGVRFGRDRL